MTSLLRSRPWLALACSLFSLVVAVAYVLGMPRSPQNVGLIDILPLAAVVFTALLTGICAFWWHSWREMRASVPPPDSTPVQRPDISDLFFQPSLVTSWYERNVAAWRGRFNDLERISQLLTFIDYSLELSRQLKVAFQLAHELFPQVTLVLFLRRGREAVFELGMRPADDGQVEWIPETHLLAREITEHLRHEIDLDKLASQDWRTFSLPLRVERKDSPYHFQPLLLWNRVVGILSMLPDSRKSLGPDELLLASLFNRQVSVFVENHSLYVEKLHQDRLSNEVEIARQVQTATLPAGPPPFPGFEIAGVCQPCREISGDYFDLIPLDSERLLVAIADVSGKGLPAALFLSKVQTLVRVLAPTHTSPAAFLGALSQLLGQEHSGTLFATMLLAIFRAGSSEVVFASAGHCKPLIIRSGTGFVEDITFEAGIPLGLFEGHELGYLDQKMDLLPGDGFFLYTDGVVDILNAQRERFGHDRLLQGLEKCLPTKGADDLLTNIMAEMNRFKGRTAHEDDLTLVYVQRESVTHG